RRGLPIARWPMPSERRAIAFRGGGFSLQRKRWASVIAFALLLLLWQAAVSLGVISPVFLPSPWSIALALGHLWGTAGFWRDIGASLSRILGGWCIGTVAGLAAGLAMGLFSLARAVGVPVISALFPIPKIALLPLLILWFGIGEPSKWATIALGV